MFPDDRGSASRLHEIVADKSCPVIRLDNSMSIIEAAARPVRPLG
jgi:hypothetical protein